MDTGNGTIRLSRYMLAEKPHACNFKPVEGSVGDLYCELCNKLVTVIPLTREKGE